MSDKPLVARVPISAWQAESLRLTAFPSSQLNASEYTWWSELVGETPQKRTSQPRLKSQQDEGPYEGGMLVLKVEPARIDWLLNPIIDQEGKLVNMPALGSFMASLDIFLSLILRWFDFASCPAMQRLAFGAVLSKPVESRQAGYRQLSAYLPSVKLDPEGSSDFYYQINRIRNSNLAIKGLKINRFSKWSVALWKLTGFSVENVNLKYITDEGQNYCRLELDINTVPDFQGDLQGEQLPLVFQELVDLGKEIAREGDIP